MTRFAMPGGVLAFAFRRAIWAVPTIFGVSFVVFLLTTLLPDPAPEAGEPGDVEARLTVDDARRTRFLDLPRFVNVAPRDVRTRVEECVAHIVSGDDDAVLCERRLAQIGGAGLPHLLPRFDNLPPTERGRIALALRPVAARMGRFDLRELENADRAITFWRHFWDDHSVDFTQPAVRRTVKRFEDRDNELLRSDLLLVDTFGLEELMLALKSTDDPRAVARLTQVAAHVTDRDATVSGDQSPSAIRAAVQDWLSWWYVHETDYVVLEGGNKVAASISQTRYAKWVLGSVTGQLGLSTRDGQPVFDKLLTRAPVTIGMAFLALLLAGAIAVPLGVLTAWRRGHTVDHVTAFVLFGLSSIPTFLLAELLSTFGRASGAGYILPILALATVSVSIMTQQQRASMIEALREDYVRAARARGARTLRVSIVHALRNALVPTVSLAGVQFPAILGAAFVVEEIFGVQGMGWETLRAIEARDAAWMVAVTLACAVVSTLCLALTDVAHGLLDPRVRERQTTRRVA